MRKQQDIDRYFGEIEAREAAEAAAANQPRNQRAIEAALNGSMSRDVPADAEDAIPRYVSPAPVDGIPVYEGVQPAPKKRMSPRKAAWLARIAVFVVFALNVMCAIQFIAEPLRYAAAYGLPTTAESGAMVAGLGVAFLMWNATYPAVIFSPRRFRALYVVVLIQQAIGLVGESCIWANLIGQGLGNGLMAAGIMRFVIFDAAGLVIMLAAFIALVRSAR
jgi:hypothetical protein